MLSQVEELYVEILYTILHMIGCDADREEQAELVNHLKVAFHMDPEKHKKLLDIAMMREVSSSSSLRPNWKIQFK